MKRTVKQTKEDVVEAALVARVAALDGLCLKVQVIGRRGFFDRLILLPGNRIIFCECKRPRGGRVSAHQIWYVREFRERGADVAIVRNSEDIDTLLSPKRD